MISFFKRHWVLTSILVLLIIVRAFLPYGIKYSINWFLGSKLEDYTGSIRDFDLSLYRGAYQVEGLRISKKSAGESPPFLTIEEIDISLAWRGIFKGKVMGDLVLTRPVIRFADSSDEKKKQYGQNKNDWTQIGGKLVPIGIEMFRIVDGEVYFRNEELRIPLLLEVKAINIEGKNLTNISDSQDKLPSSIDATAQLYSAPATLKGAVNLTKGKPDADLDFKLEKFNLTTINPLMFAYGPVTFNKGDFDFYSELAVKDGNLNGYLKPVFKKIDVVTNQERFFSIKHFAVEVVAATVNLFFRNGKTREVVTKINVEGTMESPKIDLSGALSYSIDNAFGAPKSDNFENSISLPR